MPLAKPSARRSSGPSEPSAPAAADPAMEAAEQATAEPGTQTGGETATETGETGETGEPRSTTLDKLARLEEIRKRRANERLASRTQTRSQIEEDRARLRAEAEARAEERRQAHLRAREEAAAEKARAAAEEKARKEAEAPLLPPSPVPLAAASPDGQVSPPQPSAPLPSAPQPSVTLPSARLRRRHWGILISFVLVVLLPGLATGAYLWRVAQDQYAATVAFSVRQEETQSSLDILGGITRLAGSSTSDTDILYEFIRSQDMVAQVAQQLNGQQEGQVDLRAAWAKAWPQDPVFAFDPSGTIEDLHAYWLRMVRLSYDAGTGIITVRVNAFDPDAAQIIATAIYDGSSRMINALSEEARADATRYAAEERDRAFEGLARARQSLTAFRLRTQIVDIASDLQGQMGLLNTLQAQLAAVLIELDLLRETTQPGDPRIRQTERRKEVIEARITAERAKFGEDGKGPGGEDYARIAAEFERLTVEREFAEATYQSALAAYNAAVSEAQRQSRYLAAHIRPTRAEQPLYPQRSLLTALTGFFLLMFWGVGVLIYYSVRDRR